MPVLAYFSKFVKVSGKSKYSLLRFYLNQTLTARKGLRMFVCVCVPALGVPVFVCVCLCLFVPVWVYLLVKLYACFSVCLCVCILMSVCIHTRTCIFARNSMLACECNRVRAISNVLHHFSSVHDHMHFRPQGRS